MFDFNSCIEDINVARQRTEELKIKTQDNTNVICAALENTKFLNGCYLEFGVYRGSTLLTAYEFSKIRKINRKFIGVDSFSGFVQAEKKWQDEPGAFKTLREKGAISDDHYKKAMERLSSIKDEYHLKNAYFQDIGNIFEHANDRRITLIKAPFKEAFKQLSNEQIAVLHLDCDLYDSYRECLEAQIKNVVKNGIIILDEYYSLKYPGARIAVDEFLNQSQDVYGLELHMIMTGSFERWFIKKNK